MRWRKTRPEKEIVQAKKDRAKRLSIPQNRLNSNMSRRVRYSIKNKNRLSWQKLLGYTISELILHLEVQFQDGMSWKNYGMWHIDHIRPLVAFSFSSYKDIEFTECWALSNLQPLWAKDNMSKSSKCA